MDDDLIDLSLITLIGYAAYKTHKTQKRVHSIKKHKYVSHNLKTDFRLNMKKNLLNDPKRYLSLIRMQNQTFQDLQNIIKVRREEDCSKLIMTILYLAHGTPTSVLSVIFSLPIEEVDRIELQMCDLIWYFLNPRFLGPMNAEKQKAVSNNIYDDCSLPNCVGALQAKIIQTSPPTENAIKIIASCDTNYKFTKIYITTHETESNLEKLHKVLPSQTELPFTNIQMPYYMVSDNICSTTTRIIRPYAGKFFNEKCRYFNHHILYILSLIENTFGVLAARWKILQTPLVMDSTKAITIIQTCMVLHNYLIVKDKNYCPNEYVDSYDKYCNHKANGLWRKETIPLANSGCIGLSNVKDTFQDQINILKDYIFQYKA